MTFDNVNVSPDMARLQRAAARARNEALAQMLREALKLHEASWIEKHHQAPVQDVDMDTGKLFISEPRWIGKYGRDMDACIHEVVGDDPIALILDCLFTAGFSEMWEFCDQVLGKEDKA